MSNYKCRHLSIFEKENHNARNTALTKVVYDPNVNLKDAMEFAGHRAVKTFINYYCFSQYSDEQKQQNRKRL